MPVRPVEQAEPVGEPHAGQVHAIIDGPVEPAMVGEQELVCFSKLASAL